MATATKKAPARKTAKTSAKATSRKSEEPLERINRSIDAAEVAVKDLRAGAEKGTRDLIRDLERTLKHARANTERVGKAISKDVRRALRS
jgi:hypothetical protein